MNRIDQMFDLLRVNNRRALIPFFTAGDPSLEATVPIMHALVAGGADLIELGVPFSDPMADGPVIQKASERAIERGAGLRKVLAFVTEFRNSNQTTPVVLMGYLNPIEMFGREKFAAAAKRAGVDGLLLVDCPPEEAADMQAALLPHDLHQIMLVSPTTVGHRLVSIATQSRGFVYVVAFAGITGADNLIIDSINTRVQEIRALTQSPIAVGFGIKDAASAKSLAEHADAVVIGSALVQKLAETNSIEAAELCAKTFLQPIRLALDQNNAS